MADEDKGLAEVKDITVTGDERKDLDQLDEKVVDEEKPEEKGDEEELNIDKVDTDKVDEEDEDEKEDEDEEITDSLYQRLRAKDKNIFKEIPELKEVIFREAALTERFPTVKDADEALEALNTLNAYNEDILSGKSETILESLNNTNKDALQDFVANFIPSVEKVNKDLYYEMLAPEFKKMFRIMAKNPDERISVSATNLHYAVFGDTNIDKDVGLKRPEAKSKGEEELTKREKEFEAKIVNNFAVDVKKSCQSRIKKSISSAFANSGLTPFMVETLTDKILQRVGDELEGDSRHMGAMNSLWRQAKSAGFTTDWKDRIVSAYLSRAKTVVPKHRQKILADAKLSVKEGEIQDKKRIVPTNQSPTKGFSGGKLDATKIDWSKTDERSLLDGKVTYKK